MTRDEIPALESHFPMSKGTAYWVGYDIYSYKDDPIINEVVTTHGRTIVCAVDARAAIDAVAAYLNGDVLRLANTKQCSFLITSVNKHGDGKDGA